MNAKGDRLLMKMKKRLLSILLSLVLVLGLVPGLSLTAYADDPYANLKNTTTVIKFDSKDWYLIDYDYDENTVTLLSKECVGASQYNPLHANAEYDSSIVKTKVDNYYTEKISSNVKTAIVDDKMFLLTTDQATTIEQANQEVLKCNRASGAN